MAPADVSPITRFAQLDPTQTYSYADYLTWKFDEFVELIRGKVMRPMASPRRQHQRLSRRIEFPIEAFLRGKRCEMYHAPFDVRLTSGGPNRRSALANGDAQIQTVVQPDICVVCDPAKLDDRGCLGAPDWIVEIVSPGNASHDTRTKYDLYEECGILEYWIVFPGLKTVTTYVLENGRYRLVAEYAEAGPLPVATLPGLTLDWTDIFEGS